MDYREHAKDLLSRRKNLISAYSAIKSELESLEQEKESAKLLANGCDGGASFDERIINILADIEDCRFRRNVVERELLKIEKGMNGLDDYFRDIINLFFIEHAERAVETLMERWFKERSTVYRDRCRALEQFTRSVYGVVQI